MTCRLASRPWLVVVLTFAALMVHGCEGCENNGSVTLKTIELPGQLSQGSPGFGGSKGWCLYPGSVPPTAFSPGPGEVMVGFDDYFKAGSGPFPCDDIRAQVFRGGATFDLSQFDAVVSATLLFETAHDVSRDGETVAHSPPTSYATTLGVRTKPAVAEMPDDDEVSLPPGPTFSLDVSSTVRDWTTNVRPNFGFVLGGPRGVPDQSDPPEDNLAQVSWYRNFRLSVVYNPALNPRAPQ